MKLSVAILICSAAIAIASPVNLDARENVRVMQIHLDIKDVDGKRKMSEYYYKRAENVSPPPSCVFLS